MQTLLLRLAGPLQSWGARSRFATRGTEMAPTKSGVVGLVAAALGIPRDGSLECFAGLGFGTRTDAAGTLLDDFQTAITLDEKPERMPLTRRHYLQDAVFVAGLSTRDRGLLESFREALRSPVFPLYLGRRSCPPDGPILTWLVEEDLEAALRGVEWQASDVAKRTLANHVRGGAVRLPMVVDADGSAGGFVETIADEPLSFDPMRRRYAARAVRRTDMVVLGASGPAAPEHDPLAVFDEVKEKRA